MNAIAFIQVHGRQGLLEWHLPEGATRGHLHAVLLEVGVEVDDDTLIFIEELEVPLGHEHDNPIPHLKHGCRIHVTKCHKIRVTVHYLEHTEETFFAPGARVRRVKAWAVEKFKLDHHDATEHVLQICGSTDRPATDTPIHDLTKVPACAVCFDLVPEKRVEG